jgi:hypothetical protein
MATPPARDHRAPEGAHCGAHPDRTAHFTCPRCGSYACITCWHPEVERCTQCLQRDPAAAAAPIAWEQRERPLLRRYFGTFAGAFSPFKTAPAFAHGEVGDALRFMLLSALPLALLSGVIPYTRTLLFAGNFAVRVIGHPSGAQIGGDVVRSMLVGFGVTAIEFVCLLLPFTSLVRAYAPARRDAAQRALHYRLWLLPAAALLAYLAASVLPLPNPEAATPGSAAPGLLLALEFVRLLCLTLVVLLILTMSATARLACGLSPLISTVVVVVSLVVMLCGAMFADLAITRLLPDLQLPST